MEVQEKVFQTARDLAIPANEKYSFLKAVVDIIVIRGIRNSLVTHKGLSFLTRISGDAQRYLFWGYSDRPDYFSIKTILQISNRTKKGILTKLEWWSAASVVPTRNRSLLRYLVYTQVCQTKKRFCIWKNRVLTSSFGIWRFLEDRGYNLSLPRKLPLSCCTKPIYPIYRTINQKRAYLCMPT